jgi:hypothetical protein
MRCCKHGAEADYSESGSGPDRFLGYRPWHPWFLSNADCRFRTGESISWATLYGVNAQPLLQFDELHRTALVEANQEEKGFEVVEFQQISVDLQKAAVTVTATRLFPSTNGWFCDKLSQSAAAS